ncbi:DUF4062 domain-containing protein [Thalassospira profundimaris]|uniref:DUF4062 domain-containing protein n=1 Tax=Thalassospira profundimaris TaxID=502049 RepID=UPI0002871D52|nr:DUF4062 domain-containing protein [Thalassospira profundimaris]EKF07608.1 hypothetical protein TH2_14384 [Thalassospira profundimaris WP0211]
MGKPEAWSKELTQDKLDVFVSSRLQECKAERAAARRAIQSINHNPVLFEHLGARSIKPRNLYLPRLRDSQLMIAIYRDGYGYIDSVGGMGISGLEDEYQFAKEHGIPLLLYVFADASGRDERLTRLIDAASSNVTVWYYNTPEELEGRIKDDVTSEITRFVIRPEVARGVLANSPRDLLDRAVRRQGELVDRPEALSALKAESEKNPILCVYGRAGIGKTTLVAQHAEQEQAIYVRVNGLSPLDLFSVCAGAVGNLLNGLVYSTLQGAILGFATAWAEAKQITLVVDECEFIPELLKAVEQGGGATLAKRIILTVREPVEGLPIFAVPALEASEISRMLGGDIAKSGEIAASTPLEIQRLLQAREEHGAPMTTLTRELLSYLALSPAPLGADELLSLVGNESLSIEGLYQQLQGVKRLIDDSPTGFRLSHDDIAASMREEISQTPQRLRFYVGRLQAVFEERGDFRLLYRVVSLLPDNSADEYATAALHQSSRVGDFRLGRDIAEKLLVQALDTERRTDALELMLSLVYPMELLGEVSRAAELLDEADKLAANLGPEEQARVAEVSLSSRARRTLAEDDVLGLEETRGRYRTSGAIWDAARIGLELSAIFISAKDFERAVEVLRPTLAEFQEVGDEYGVDLTERNLAAALASLSGHDAEVDELAHRIEQRSNESVDPRRQRAWYNNILSRRYRISGRLNDAEKVTKETIALSIELGDESLTALTYVNLGNVYRDKKDVQSALDAYDNGGKHAQRCGRRDIEADSSRLRAGMLNDLYESAAVVPDRFEQAKLFALHAIGLLKGTIYQEAIARAYVELGEAEMELGNRRAAASAYFSAAEHFRLVPDGPGYDHAIIRGAEYSLDEDVRFYLNKVANAFGATLDTEASIGDQFIALISPLLEGAPKEFSVRMMGRHLQTVRTQLPPLLRPVLLEAYVDALESLPQDEPADNWRPLYAGFLLPFLLQDSRSFDIHQRLSKALTRLVDGFDVRYTAHGDSVWTVVLEFETPVTLSIMPLGDSAAEAAAAQALALFLKAFENEFGEIVGRPDVVELSVQIASYDEMPRDIQKMANEMFDLEKRVAEDDVVVSRTEDFGRTPTMIFLGSNFLQRAVAGEGVSGSMQRLFGLTLVELIYQFLRSQVNEDEIRPKIVSLVRETIS